MDTASSCVILTATLCGLYFIAFADEAIGAQRGLLTQGRRAGKQKAAGLNLGLPYHSFSIYHTAAVPYHQVLQVLKLSGLNPLGIDLRLMPKKGIISFSDVLLFFLRNWL